MKRIKVFHVFMTMLLCVMLISINIAVPGSAMTAQAAGKDLSSLSVSGITSKEYTGKALTQSPVIKDGAKTLKKGTDYTLSYKDNKEIGTATVTMNGKGNYSGFISKNFQIIPPKVQGLAAKSVVTGTAEITWSSDFEQILSGYQVYYATSKTGKYTKLATIQNNTYKAELTGGKTFYVKVRAYAKVGGTVYYGKFSEAVKVTILKEQSAIKIIDSGRAYGNYIKTSDIPEEIVKQMRFVYPDSIFVELSVQYLDKDTNKDRWVDFFGEVSEENNLVMGKNEYVGMIRFEILSKDSSDTVQQYYEAMKPDEHTEWYSNNRYSPVLIYDRAGGIGIYMITLNQNPAVDSDGWIQKYVDMNEDGYIMMIVGSSEWKPN